MVRGGMWLGNHSLGDLRFFGICRSMSLLSLFLAKISRALSVLDCFFQRFFVAFSHRLFMGKILRQSRLLGFLRGDNGVEILNLAFPHLNFGLYVIIP